jgi:hypothetical protein
MASAFHALVDVQVSAFHGRNLSKGLFETNNPYLRVVVGDVQAETTVHHGGATTPFWRGVTVHISRGA